MTESRRRLPVSQTEPTRSWDTAAIADRLGVPAEPRVDHIHGTGVRYRLGHPPTTELEIFPSVGSVKITSETLALSLVRQEPPILSSEAVVFTTSLDPDRQWLSVSPGGATTLILNPHTGGHEDLSATPDAATAPTAPDETIQPLSGDAVPSVGVSENATDGLENRDTKERVTLAGRLGADIRFRTTRNGKVIASFPLAITQDDGSVQWRDVLVFNQRAEKLRSGEPPRKGQFCDIVGFRHEREVKGKDGARRTIEEIYAVVIKPR